MSSSKKFQPKKSSNFKRGKKTLEIKVDGLEPRKFIVFTLRFLDRSQGQSLEKWEEEQLLAKALNRVQGLSKTPHNLKF